MLGFGRSKSDLKTKEIEFDNRERKYIEKKITLKDKFTSMISGKVLYHIVDSDDIVYDLHVVLSDYARSEMVYMYRKMTVGEQYLVNTYLKCDGLSEKENVILYSKEYNIKQL